MLYIIAKTITLFIHVYMYINIHDDQGNCPLRMYLQTYDTVQNTKYQSIFRNTVVGPES